MALLPWLAWAEAPPPTASSTLDLSAGARPGPFLPPPLASRAALVDQVLTIRYDVSRILDNNSSTAWVSEEAGHDARLTLPLGEESFVESIEVTGYGSLAGEPPSMNNRVKTLSIGAPDFSADVPARTCYFPDQLKPRPCLLYGHTYSALDLTLEELYVASPGARLAISEVKINRLPLSPVLVRAALGLPEEATLSVIRNPGGGGQFLAGWSYPIEGKMYAELASFNGGGAGIDVVWRSPIKLQMRTVPSLDLRMESISIGGPPALLLSYDFSGEGVTREYARVYILGGGPAFPSWETSLLRGPYGSDRVIPRFSGGRALLTTFNGDYGFSLTEEIHQYMPAYRQFKPMGHQLKGARVSATSKGRPAGGADALFDGEISRPWLVAGDGIDTTITVTLDRPRRVSAVMIFPGVGSKAEEETGAGESNARYARPAEVELKLDNFSTGLLLDDSPEFQALLEGVETPGAETSRTVTLRIKSVHPGVPGQQMAIGEIKIFCSDPG